jgi:hypothetical protein
MTDAAESKFAELYGEWRKRLDGDQRLSLSSRTSDYVDTAEYQAIVDLGAAGLPAVMREIESGDWMLNDAAIAMAGIRLEDVVPDIDEATYSEQEIAKQLVAWWHREAPAG